MKTNIFVSIACLIFICIQCKSVNQNKTRVKDGINTPTYNSSTGHSHKLFSLKLNKVYIKNKQELFIKDTHDTNQFRRYLLTFDPQRTPQSMYQYCPFRLNTGDRTLNLDEYDNRFVCADRIFPNIDESRFEDKGCSENYDLCTGPELRTGMKYDPSQCETGTSLQNIRQKNCAQRKFGVFGFLWKKGGDESYCEGINNADSCYYSFIRNGVPSDGLYHMVRYISGRRDHIILKVASSLECEFNNSLCKFSNWTYSPDMGSLGGKDLTIEEITNSLLKVNFSNIGIYHSHNWHTQNNENAFVNVDLMEVDSKLKGLELHHSTTHVFTDFPEDNLFQSVEVIFSREN